MARNFNGTSDWMDINVNPDLGAIYAIWAWVQTTSILGIKQIIDSDESTNGDRCFQFRRNAANFEWIPFSGNSATSFAVTSAFAVNTWTFVGATRRSGDIFTYHGTSPGNLTETDHGAFGVNDNDPSTIMIGAGSKLNDHSDPADFHSGDIAWIGIINDRSLTLADFNLISLRGWRNPSLFTLPLLGLSDPEPDWSGNGNSSQSITGTSVADNPPVAPPFGFDLGWQGAFTPAFAGFSPLQIGQARTLPSDPGGIPLGW